MPRKKNGQYERVDTHEVMRRYRDCPNLLDHCPALAPIFKMKQHSCSSSPPHDDTHYDGYTRGAAVIGGKGRPSIQEQMVCSSPLLPLDRRCDEVPPRRMKEQKEAGEKESSEADRHAEEKSLMDAIKASVRPRDDVAAHLASLCEAVSVPCPLLSPAFARAQGTQLWRSFCGSTPSVDLTFCYGLMPLSNAIKCRSRKISGSQTAAW